MENQEKFICENCGKEHNGSYGSGRFCSKSCANTRHHSKETKNKISCSFKNKYINLYGKDYYSVKYCKDCGSQITKKSKSGYCQHCFQKYTNKRENVRKKIRTKQKENYKNGILKGWLTRNIESYPEKFWKQVLENNNIEYIFNMPFKRKFLDFVIVIDNLRIIDLEIDGKQHKSRIDYDNERDKFLLENGFLVYRIEWNEINTEQGNMLMKKKINSFLNFIKYL